MMTQDPDSAFAGSHPKLWAMLSAIATSTLLATTVHAQSFTQGFDKVVNSNCSDGVNPCTQEGEQLAVDKDGNGLAIWLEPNGSSQQKIIVSKYDPYTNAWQTQGTHLHGEVGTAPDVGFDRHGNGLAIWIRDLPDGSRALRSSRYVKAQNMWTTPTTVFVRFGEPLGPFRLFEVAENGDAFAIVSGRNAAFHIVRFDGATGTWGTRQNTPYYPKALTVDAQGNATVPTIIGGDGTTSNRVQLYARRYNAASKSWSDSSLFENFIPTSNPDTGMPNSEASFSPISASSDRFGNAMVVYQRYEKKADGTVVRQMKSYRYQAGKSAWVFKSVPKLNNNPIRSLDTDADRSGNVVAAWTQFVGPYAKAVASRYSSSTGTWSTPKVIQAGNFISRDIDVETDFAGNAFAIWSQRSDSGTTSNPSAIYRQTATRYRLSTNTWDTPPLTIQDANRNGYKPHLGVRDNGVGFVLWNSDSQSSVDSSYRKQLVFDRLQLK